MLQQLIIACRAPSLCQSLCLFHVNSFCVYVCLWNLFVQNSKMQSTRYMFYMCMCDGVKDPFPLLPFFWKQQQQNRNTQHPIYSLPYLPPCHLLSILVVLSLSFKHTPSPRHRRVVVVFFGCSLFLFCNDVSVSGTQRDISVVRFNQKGETVTIWVQQQQAV